MGLAGPAWAAAFAVDRTDDPDLMATPTADNCTAPPNDCSLRGAISAVNAAAGADEIAFAVNARSPSSSRPPTRTPTPTATSTSRGR